MKEPHMQNNFKGNGGPLLRQDPTQKLKQSFCSILLVCTDHSAPANHPCSIQNSKYFDTVLDITQKTFRRIGAILVDLLYGCEK